MSGFVAAPMTALELAGPGYEHVVVRLYEAGFRYHWKAMPGSVRAWSSSWSIPIRQVRRILGALSDAGLLVIDWARSGDRRGSWLQVHHPKFQKTGGSSGDRRSSETGRIRSGSEADRNDRPQNDTDKGKRIGSGSEVDRADVDRLRSGSGDPRRLPAGPSRAGSTRGRENIEDILPPPPPWREGASQLDLFGDIRETGAWLRQLLKVGSTEVRRLVGEVLDQVRPEARSSTSPSSRRPEAVAWAKARAIAWLEAADTDDERQALLEGCRSGLASLTDTLRETHRGFTTRTGFGGPPQRIRPQGAPAIVRQRDFVEGMRLAAAEVEPRLAELGRAAQARAELARAAKEAEKAEAEAWLAAYEAKQAEEAPVVEVVTTAVPATPTPTPTPPTYLELWKAGRASLEAATRLQAGIDLRDESPREKDFPVGPNNGFREAMSAWKGRVAERQAELRAEWLAGGAS